ncbi:MAG: lytic transglycosylase domain-containing protein [Hyphomonadaceae bacterium]|nr:lytic transglycosylase domain-containing protein [Hyphomonadaceae bacterium]
MAGKGRQKGPEPKSQKAKKPERQESIMTPEAIGGSPIRQAIANASMATGMDFDFLLTTAVRESSLNPRAEARTSSATGLFQFLDATWLTTMKRHGAKHGYGGEAALIEIGADGRPQVADPNMRRIILDMRYDPEVSARMAAEFANDNADYLRVRTGQEPQPGDLYAAHFLGAQGAAELLNTVRDTAVGQCSQRVSQRRRSQPTHLYREGGGARTVAEVLDNLRATALRDAPPVSQREMGGDGVHMFGSRRQPSDMVDQFTTQAMMASISRTSGFAAQPNDFIRILAEQNFTSDQNAITLDPTMLTHLYGAGDQLREATALQAVNSIINSGMASGSIAQAFIAHSK